MKILFDISVLGLGYFNQRGRTGVYRYVEALAGCFDRYNDIAIDFSAIRSTVTMAKAICYLQGESVFPADKTLLKPQKMAASHATKWYHFLLRHKLPPAVHRIFTVLDLLERVVVPGQSVPSDGDMEAYDIFHSTFYPLPPPTNKGPLRFLTVYDLIPLLFPEYTRKNEQRVVRDALNSIGPDDYVVAISESTKNDLCGFTGIAPERVFVTPLAASCLFFQQSDKDLQRVVRERYGIPEGPYLLSLGTLEPRKNIPALIRCFAKIVRQEHIKDLNLVLVGTKGWQYHDIFEQFDAVSDLQHRIIFTGYVADIDLAALYSGASMFVYPSLYEGFGLPPLEAMQCGVPVITSNTSSLPEVVGDAGLLIDPRDDDALCQAVLDLYNNPSKSDELAARSSDRAAQFSWQKCTEKTLLAYQRNPKT